MRDIHSWVTLGMVGCFGVMFAACGTMSSWPIQDEDTGGEAEVDTGMPVDDGEEQHPDTGMDTGTDEEQPYETPSSPCCLLYTSPSPRDGLLSRMPSSA